MAKRRLSIIATIGILATATLGAGLPVHAQGAATTIPVRIATCDPVPVPYDAANVDATGTWAGDDGGIYYVRQVGDQVWWNGMDGLGGPIDVLGRGWNNVAFGTLDEKGRLNVEWADTTRGAVRGTGRLLIAVEANAGGQLQMRRIGGTGGFGGSMWHPCAITGPADATAVLPPDGTYTADITPEDLLAAGGWPEDGSHWGHPTTWTFDSGSFSITSDVIKEGDCVGTASGVGNVMRLTFENKDDCWGQDDLLVNMDGADISLVWVGCGTFDDCNARTDRSIFERTWTRVP